MIRENTGVLLGASKAIGLEALSGVILSALVISVQLSEATNNSMDLRCNLGSHQQLCDLDLINSDLHQLNDIARETENCIYTRSGTVSPQDPRHLVNDVMCLVKNISYNIQCNKSIANNCSNVEKLFCNGMLETVFEENKETFQQFECITCIVAKSLHLLNSTDSISNIRNDGKYWKPKRSFSLFCF
ncbi:hypothetical protein ANN_25344 [Periplaneta americana]|uniref:Uncharacterized protein n=1 Tax=Periplaneta americana TaxID=6978 RepID=A0ABQ8S1Q3_PERAM|nr:hypothetical protein ANN_25344 [Periplaneta americana]